MQVSVTEAKGQLTEFVRRAEAGEEVVLIRHGMPQSGWSLCVGGLMPIRGARRSLGFGQRGRQTDGGCQCRPQPGFFVRRPRIAK